jgi:sulfate transporter 4
MQDYPEAIYLWKVHKFDCAVWMAAFLGTVFLGVEPGLAIAVGVSLLIVIYEAVYPHTSVLGRLPQTSLYRNVKQYPNLERYDGLVIVRLNSPIFFANAQSVRDKIRKYKRTSNEELAKRNAGQVKYIILDLSPVTHIDTTALHVLDDMCKTQLRLGTQMCFCNPSISLMIKFIKSGLVDVVGRNCIFPAVTDAVHWCLMDMDRKEAATAATAALPESVYAVQDERNGENATAANEERNESGAIVQEDNV